MSGARSASRGARRRVGLRRTANHRDAGAPGRRRSPSSAPASDSSASALIPPGFGTLQQDDIAIVLEPEGVHVAAIPLDESVIRTLAPDSYRGLQRSLDSKRATIAQRASMRGIREPRVWYVRFYGLHAGRALRARPISR